MINSSNLIDLFRKHFQQLGDPERAMFMSKYLKNQFEFFGVNAPARKLLGRQLVHGFDWADQKSFLEFVDLCWKEHKREFNYTALDLSFRFRKKLNQDSIPFYVKLIGRESWWETVDGIAPQIIGRLIIDQPEKVKHYAEKWMAMDELWYQRSALILQLMYKDKTDFDLLKKLILQKANSREFFIQKAAGWALRQYSKTDPAAVQDFINKNKLPALTIREGMKFIKLSKS